MAARSATVAQAIEHHMAGRFDEAERLYLQAHRDDPDDEEVLYLLGILACDLGIADTACKFLEHALRLSPAFLEARHQLGLALLQGGRPAEAFNQFELVLQMEPQRPDAQVAAADALIAMNRAAEAVARLEPLAVDQDHADAWRMLAKAALHQGDAQRAEHYCIESQRVAPDHADTLNLLGIARLQQRNYAGAVAPLTRLLELAPHANQARNNLGTALRKLGRLADAQALFEQALEQDTEYVEARANLADALRLQGRTAEARSHLEDVIAAAPQMLSALNNYAALLQDLGEHAQALVVLERASALAPDNAQVRWNRALSELALGDYVRGWTDFESRWEGCENLRGAYSKPLQRAWSGEPIAGKRVLIWAEQGFGDTLQFIRFAGELAQRGATVLAEVQPELVALLRRTPGISQTIARGDALPEYDVHCPLMSLPHRLQLTLDALPVDERYVHPDPQREQAWAQRLQDHPHPRVGLVWAGRSRAGAVDLAAIDARRSVSLRELAPILSVSGVTFFSLQKDAAASGDCIDFSAEWTSFDDTAAFVGNLDLVISVDTSVAHLAAAMGKTVWLLNRYDSCWRWLRERDDSPWYPTLRQFRQTRPGDWQTPIRSLAVALAQRVG